MMDDDGRVIIMPSNRWEALPHEFRVRVNRDTWVAWSEDQRQTFIDHRKMEIAASRALGHELDSLRSDS